MPTIFHADDYGITAWQAREIIGLSSACGGDGALSSVSIFANSPAFEEAARMAKPHVDAGNLLIALHANLVEGHPCAPVEDIPLLVNERGTFKNDFVGLMKLSMGKRRDDLRAQVRRELGAQLDRFLAAFPEMRGKLRADSHQHTHAVPAVFDGLLDAVHDHGARLSHLRTPIEPTAPFRACETRHRIPPINRVKDALIAWLWRENRPKMPKGCETSLFSGVLLSGHMGEVDEALVRAFESEAARRAQSFEILFHPVSVPITECLDPQNEPFAAACASAGRDEEAEALRRLGHRGHRAAPATSR